MDKTTIIRHRMLYTVLLGVLTSAVSLWALWRALTLTEATRVERARDAVTAELQRLARLPPTAESLRQPPSTTYVGLHAGWDSEGDAAKLDALPIEWRPTLLAVIAESHSHQAFTRREAALGGGLGTLVVAATPTARGLGSVTEPPTLWVAVLLPASAYLAPWRWFVVLLAMCTALLVVTAVRGAWVFRKNAEALHASLAALGKDLTAPVPKSNIVELAGIADGIGRLARELSEARAAEARLQAELAQKERLAALGRVAAGVAHEVRNPLASIKLRLDLTANSQPLPEATKRAIEAASAEIMRLDRLVNDLLLVAGKQAGPKRTVALGDLVRARADALLPWSQSRGIGIVVAGDGEAVADPDSVARAVDNVLRNAVEASPPAGHVDVHIGLASQAGRIEVLVDDHGKGVEDSRQKELFEPFFTTKSEGTGLGLAISRAIMRAHGGELTYARVGELTRFSLSLPQAT